ncbi:hypothetical protein [Synechococcus sp. PCC 7336]|uniref:hypothetical protein n=1 Tax=Synechococcus sp. PCC 7336 TaxID=195250 RepID=UPI0012EA87EC|nr:hypothetical protein [Synechococcus sp. PCC 7336]
MSRINWKEQQAAFGLMSAGALFSWAIAPETKSPDRVEAEGTDNSRAYDMRRIG